MACQNPLKKIRHSWTLSPRHGNTLKPCVRRVQTLTLILDTIVRSPHISPCSRTYVLHVCLSSWFCVHCSKDICLWKKETLGELQSDEWFAVYLVCTWGPGLFKRTVEFSLWWVFCFASYCLFLVLEIIGQSFGQVNELNYNFVSVE